MTSCLSYWGTTESIALVTKIFSRITDHLLPLGGVTLWLDLRWYPSLLTFYSAGISAIAANKYDYLYSIMYNNIISTKPINGKNPYVLALYYEINDSISAFKLIPGYEKNFVPMSEYLYKTLQSSLDDHFYLGKDYDNYFDYFEIFFALVFADILYKEDDYFFAHVGRFTWKYKRSFGGNNNLQNMISEAEKQKNNWEPLKYGFFNGSYDRFKIVSDKYISWISSFAWH